MCTMECGPLTLSALLQDPLTRMLMHRDGVSEQDFSALLLRVQGLLGARVPDLTAPIVESICG